MSEKRALMRVFELQKKDVIGSWIALNNEKLYKSNSASSIMRAIKSNRMS
jgi:hypothetical protein